MSTRSGDFIYSMSEEKRDDFGVGDRRIEKIGSTNDLNGRLYEHNNHSSILIPFTYNWHFRIINISGRSVRQLEEEEIHPLLSDRHVYLGGGTEFFNKNVNKPSYQLIREYLDCNNIRYEFDDKSNIQPKKRKKRHKFPQNSKTKKLRDYQLKAHSLMDKHNRHTFIFPAGTGKGFTFKTHIAKHPGKYLILAPTTNLVAQIAKRLHKRGVQVYSYDEYRPPELPGHCCIVSTYHSSKAFKDIMFDAIHYDEAHRVVISSKNDLSLFQFMIKNSKAKKHFFWTATPKFLIETSDMISMDSQGYFGDKYELALDEAIEKGYICDYIIRIDSKQDVETKLLNIFIDKLTRPWKVIIFFNRMEDADKIRDLLRENLDGYNVYSFHSRSKSNKILKTLGKNKRCVLCVCGMMSTGYDQPDIDAIIHYNVTSSVIEHVQRNGRGQRISPNKKCNSIYYFVKKVKDIEVIISQLSKQDKRINRYSVTPIYNGNSDGQSHSGGKLTCTINMNEHIELTREMLRYFASERDSKAILRSVLRHRNRYRIECIDRQQVIREYSLLFPEVQKICEAVDENFPKFCLSSTMYESYTSRFVTDKNQIYVVCEKNKIYTPRKYKELCEKLNLPPYNFILNGGVGIKNLSEFLPKSVQCEEN